MCFVVGIVDCTHAHFPTTNEYDESIDLVTISNDVVKYSNRIEHNSSIHLSCDTNQDYHVDRTSSFDRDDFEQ
jgi:hypothetical protein